MATTNQSQMNKTGAIKSHPRGSGTDQNSDTRRLQDEDNLQDKTVEDSFPASDPPSQTPMSGTGRKHRDIPASMASDFKENGAEQFEYGRRTEAKTFNFETNTNRFKKGNPDVGSVDLGNISADRPAQKDDDDHFD